MELSERLSCLASLVRPGSRVADIGTDHALLPVFLVKTGVCRSAIAVDVKAGPVAAAQKAVKAADLLDAIDVRLGDGLSPISPDEVEDIVIAGMGGETMVEILKAAPWVLSDRYRLILQPMTRVEVLHRFLYEQGFEIEEEHLMEDSGHRYVYLTAHFAGNAPIEDPFSHWRGGFLPEEGRLFWRMNADHLDRRAKGIEKTEPKEASILRELAQKLRAL